jgi:hypothetical protein
MELNILTEYLTARFGRQVYVNSYKPTDKGTFIVEYRKYVNKQNPETIELNLLEVLSYVATKLNSLQLKIEQGYFRTKF